MVTLLYCQGEFNNIMETSISSLLPALSQERIAIYQNQVKTAIPTLTPSHISVKALELYLWNIQISSALFEIIGFYEVTLRNKIFNVINKAFTHSIQDNYFIHSLPPLARNKIKTLISTKGITSPLIVSRLNFSFWTTVLENYFYYSGKSDKQGNPILPRLYKYNNALFDIPKRKTKHQFNRLIKKLIKITIEVNELRNRICHHEPIFKSDIHRIFIKMLFVIKYLDRNIYHLILKIERVTDILKNKPF